ncbi:MAG: hypothetical protein N2257_06385 [Thermodesulfovibrionales bacterium]|nr:hypothetical protein [Thermodesulfovibrionales bacterium]
MIYGCGYRFYSASLSDNSDSDTLLERTCIIKEIIVRNKTHLPGLEDRLMHVLSEELLKKGCILNNDRGTSIYAEVRDFNMTVQAERSNQVLIYEIIMKIEFNISMPDGSVISRTLSSPFITDFSSGARIEDILLARDREIDRTIRDISVELIDEYISLLRRD